MRYETKMAGRARKGRAGRAGRGVSYIGSWAAAAGHGNIRNG